MLWFDSVELPPVFLTELGAKVLLGVVGGLLTAALVASSLVIAYRTRPIYAPASTNQQPSTATAPLSSRCGGRHRSGFPPCHRPALRPRRRRPVADFLLWRNRVPFGQERPAVRHGRRLLRLHPAVADASSSPSSSMVADHRLIIVGRVHPLHLRRPAVAGPRRRTTSAARLHLSILLAAIVLVRAASYWLERYSLTTKAHRPDDRHPYTDANAVLPTKAILAIAVDHVRADVPLGHLDQVLAAADRRRRPAARRARSWWAASSRR